MEGPWQDQSMVANAYVLSEVEITDERAASQYRELAARSIAAHGGKYLVRGALPLALEGQWPARSRLVIVEFPSLDAARAWYGSTEYAGALALSRSALRRRLLIVEGLPP